MCKRGNPILKFVRNVPWEYGDIVPDYQFSPTACGLYLRFLNAFCIIAEDFDDDTWAEDIPSRFTISKRSIERVERINYELSIVGLVWRIQAWYD